MERLEYESPGYWQTRAATVRKLDTALLCIAAGHWTVLAVPYIGFCFVPVFGFATALLLAYRFSYGINYRAWLLWTAIVILVSFWAFIFSLSQ